MARCRRCENAARRKHVSDDFDIDVEIPEVVKAEPTVKEHLQIQRLKQRNSQLEATLNEMRSLALSGEAIRDLLGTLDAPNVIENPEWLRGAKRPRSVTGTPVVNLSDIHFDEVVSKAQLGGCNEYNREIAVASLHNFFRNTTVLTKRYLSAPVYDGIVCQLGGDLLSGNIHDELTETNEFPIQVSMLALEEILIEGIGNFADEFGKVHVPCVTGNHGRMHKKPRAKNRAFENFEWAVYQRVARYFKTDGRITFDIPEGPDAFFKLYDLNYCLTHGDQFHGGNGIGGIMVPILRGVAKKQMSLKAQGKGFDIISMGHWHQYIDMSGVVVNGSVKGYDEYAAQNNFGFEQPAQALFIAHPSAGRTFRMPVFCRREG